MFASWVFFLPIVIVIVAKLTLVAVISSKVLIAFARFVVKSKRSVMALVVFLERLVMTEPEGPITNDHFLSCTSVSTTTAPNPFGIGQHFLFFRFVRNVQTLGN